MRALPLLLLLSLPASAVDGTVINGTTGKTQPGVDVTYMKFGDAGMQPAGSAKTDAAGRFNIAARTGGPSMLQASFDGVTYNQMLTAGSPDTALTLQVYDASPSAPQAKVAQHMVLLEPAGKLSVSETVVYQNSGKVTLRDPSGATFRFYLPAEAGGNVRVRVSAPQGMPTDRAARETGEKNVYGVDYPIRPGETRFDLSYELPSASPLKFESRILHEGTTRLVTPNGVKLIGPDLEVLGQEPTTKAMVYGVNGNRYSVEVQGAGSLKAPAASGAEESENALQQSKPRIYQRLYWILGLTLVVLLMGLILLYRSGERRA